MCCVFLLLYSVNRCEKNISQVCVRGVVVVRACVKWCSSVQVFVWRVCVQLLVCELLVRSDKILDRGVCDGVCGVCMHMVHAYGR